MTFAIMIGIKLKQQQNNFQSVTNLLSEQPSFILRISIRVLR